LPAISGKLMNKNNVQIFGGTQVEKHWLKLRQFQNMFDL
jgi:hypothetical protein